MKGIRRNIQLGRIMTATLAAIGVGLLAAGCGGSSSGPGQTPAASLKRAAYVSAAAPGFKVAMIMHMSVSGQTTGVRGMEITANGAFSPASHTGEMKMGMRLPTSAGTRGYEMQMVLDRDTMYMKMPAVLAGKLPGARPWLSINLKQMGKAAGIPGYGSLVNGNSNFTDPGQYLDFLRATADGSVKDLGQVTVNGVQTSHYQADVDLAKLPNAVPAADKPAVEQMISMLQSKGVNTQMPVDAWIDASHHIRRVHISYSMSLQGASVAMNITENLSDYGPQPAPTVPSPDQTTDASALLKAG